MIKRFLPYSRQYIDKADIEKVTQVLKSDFITQGPNIVDFEKDFASGYLLGELLYKFN